MSSRRPEKTLGSMLCIGLLLMAVLFTMIPTQGSTEISTEGSSDWIEDRVVFGFHGPMPLDATDWVGDLGGEVLLVNDRVHFVLAQFPSVEEAKLAMQAGLAREDVRYAEHDAIIHFDEPVEVIEFTMPMREQPAGFLDSYVPDNPFWPDQWGPRAIDAPEAWQITLGSHDVRLAIADTGITGHHPNLEANICGPHISGSSDPLGTSGHGTHVAGIAAAEIDSGVGVAGLSQSCLMSIRVLGGGSAALATGITFAADNGADAINMSFWATENQAFRDALEYAYLEQDVVLVKSAGNGGCPGPESIQNTGAYTGSYTMTWPGPEPSVIATAALAPSEGVTRAGFSSCGNKMELAAPGQSILAPYNNGYAYLSGTSMAAPHVTGLVGLMRAVNPDLTALEVRCLLAWTADDLGPDGWDPFYGWGRINAEQAVLAANDWSGGTLHQAVVPTPCGLPLPL